MRIPFLTFFTKRKGGHGGDGGGGHSDGGGGHSSGGDSDGESSSSDSSSSSHADGSSGGGSSSSGGAEPGSNTKPGGPGDSFSVPDTSANSGEAVARPYTGGGGASFVIPSGHLFAGRTEGGGTRAQIYGTRVYGSGYGDTVRGVTGRGFPFFFWPIIWGDSFLYGDAYLHTHEYGEPLNSSRPGGIMLQAPFQTIPPNETYHIIADDLTVDSLIVSIAANCTLNSTPVAVPFNGAATDPKPEQAIQYYRASSVVLTLDGYNNTAALLSDPSLPNVPLPPTINTTFLDCLNQTIGASVPLVASGASPSSSTSISMGISGSVALMILIGRLWA